MQPARLSCINMVTDSLACFEELLNTRAGDQLQRHPDHEKTAVIARNIPLQSIPVISHIGTVYENDELIHQVFNLLYTNVPSAQKIKSAWHGHCSTLLTKAFSAHGLS